MMFISTLLILSLASGQAEVTITGLNDVEVSAGEEAVLVCQVEQPYLFCSFVNPEGKTFIQDPNVEHEGGRISFAASEDVKKSCGVKMSPVLEADSGAWRCKVTVMVNGRATVGESQAIVTVLQKDTSGSNGDEDRSEEASGVRMETRANGTTVSRSENDDGDLVEEVDWSRNETRASDLENEETEIFPSTTISPEADSNYTKANLGRAKDQNQATEPESNQVASSSSSAPQIIYEVNPSAENSDEYLHKEVSKLSAHMEEVQEDESTDLTEEQVAVVTIVALMIVAIILTAIAKIKKLLCFRVTTTEDAEDAEKSTLRMYSIEKNSKSSLDTLETNQKLLAGGILSITQEGFRVQEKPQQIKDLD